MAFFASSIIIGNVIAAMVLKTDMNKSTMFIIFTILAAIGSFIFFTLKSPKKTLFDVQFTCPEMEVAEKETTPFEDIRATLNLIMSRRML